MKTDIILYEESFDDIPTIIFFNKNKNLNIQFLTSDVENLSLNLEISANVQYFGG